MQDKNAPAKAAGSDHIGASAPQMMPDEVVSRTLRGPARFILIACAILVPLLAMNQLLNLQFFAGVVLIEPRYLFLLAALLLPLVFIAIPADPSSVRLDPPWYDWLFAAVAFAILIWFSFNAWTGARKMPVFT